MSPEAFGPNSVGDGYRRANGATVAPPRRRPPPAFVNRPRPMPTATRPDQGQRRVERFRSLWSRLTGRHKDLAVQLPLLVGVGLIQAWNMAHWPAPAFDEGTYVANAWAVQAHGALSNYTYGYGHPPLGWLTMSLWTWVSGIFGRGLYTIDVERALMVPVTVITCWLLFTLARRLGFGRIFAAAAVAVFAFSPLSLHYHRLVLLDNFAMMWTVAAFVLAATPRRSLWTFAGSGACFAASVLSKETALVLLPALVLAAAQNLDPRTRRYCWALMLSFFGLLGVSYPLYATLKGELVPGPGHVSLIGEQVTQLFTRKASGSIFNPHSPSYGIVHAWFHLDPWLLGAALLLCPIALWRRSTRPVTIAFLIQVALLLRPGYLPEMFVIGMLPFAAIVVAGAMEGLWRFAIGSWQPAVSAIPERWRAFASDFSRRTAPVARVVVAAGLGIALAVATVVIRPRWARADGQATSLQQDGPNRSAEEWLVRNLDHNKRILVDANIWIYLIQHGFDADPVFGGSTKGGFYSRTVVFYWPLGSDPAVRRYFPDGWKDFDYVVSTQGMRYDTGQLPDTAQALNNSKVIVTFGGGEQRIEIRQIQRPGR